MRQVIVILLLLIPVSALAGVTLDAACDAAGRVLITITAENDAMPADWKGLVVTRTRIGECGESEYLSDSTLGIPPPGQSQVYELDSSVPLPWVNYRFETRAVDVDGDLHDLPGAVYDHVALGVAPSFVGRIEHLGGGHYRLEGCETDCWPTCTDVTSSQLGVSEVQMLVWATHQTTIAIYAAPAGPAAAGTCYENVTEIKIAPSCSPAPNEPSSWSSLKKSYR